MQCENRTLDPTFARLLDRSLTNWWGCEEPERQFDGGMNLFISCPRCIIKARLVLNVEGNKTSDNPWINTIEDFIKLAEAQQSITGEEAHVKKNKD